MKELKSKQKARTDDDYRANERMKELKSKQKARTDDDYRASERMKELKSKQKARTNADYRASERMKELKSKQKARTDDDYRASERMKELKSKQKARSSIDYKFHEANMKQKKRMEDDYRASERMKELKIKRKARADDDYRASERMKDLQSKKQARSSKYYQEKERITKQSSRQILRNIIKERKAGKRTKKEQRIDPAFKLKELQCKRGIHLNDVIAKFHKTIAEGPVYVCTSCHQTWFKHSVTEVNRNVEHSSLFTKCTTRYKSKNGKEWICRTCLLALKNGKMPTLSTVNQISFPDKPVELDLHQLEERLVALRIPFMQMRELPRGGQLSIHGNVVNVPVDIQPTIKALPRQFEQTTIPVRIKRKMCYKKCEFTENVRPGHVLTALHWLFKNGDLYKESGVELDKEWFSKMDQSAKEIINTFMEFPSNPNEEQSDDEGHDSDTFSEISDEDRVIGNADTLIEPICPQNDSIYTFAPGEGQHPLSLYTDKDAEELSFPSIFCGQRRIPNSERDVKVNYSDIVKWELRSIDRRAANSVPNLFFKMKKIQMKQISDKVYLALRRCKSKDRNVTVAEALNPTHIDKLVNLDEGFYIFRTLRNSPPYLEKRKKDVFAMIRQLGLPTWFGSLSAGDTRWHDLLRILGELNDKISYSKQQISNMTWIKKTQLVQKDPVTCTRYFDHRVQQFINTVLKSDHAPLGILKDYFYRVEFQHRGSPHIHMLMWIQDAPKYKEDSNDKIAEYVEHYTSCQSNVSDNLTPLVDIQTHKHSKTLQKKGESYM
ncbi:uncharacterized protein LOC117345389 [Pecten maximus]|uniref:uncharacterized protein LOC117345389 n=1 Tax=Pecten maximus TaxID=6579 RepID=UPI00145850F5|nr:uncharacterized protein LOC117345389 [Pecten maximus]